MIISINNKIPLQLLCYGFKYIPNFSHPLFPWTYRRHGTKSAAPLAYKEIIYGGYFLLSPIYFISIRCLQYIPRNMQTVFALLCFVVVIHWLIFPYPSGYWHCGNLTISPVPAKQPCWIWINTSCEFIMNDCITTTKQSKQNRVHISWDILYMSILRPKSKDCIESGSANIIVQLYAIIGRCPNALAIKDR